MKLFFDIHDKKKGGPQWRLFVNWSDEKGQHHTIKLATSAREFKNGTEVRNELDHLIPALKQTQVEIRETTEEKIHKLFTAPEQEKRKDIYE